MILTTRDIRRSLHCEHGFTLTELMVTMAIMGVIILGMFAVYLNMQRTTYNQSEIVDTQQSLRVATDLLSKDVHMAGFLTLTNITAVAPGSDTDTLNLVTASSDYIYISLDGEQIIQGGKVVADDVLIDVTSAEQLDFLNVGDMVRIFRPNDGSQPHPNVFTVAAIDDGRSGGTQPRVTLNGFNNANPLDFVGGDIIARVNAGGPNPSTVSWSLNAGNLQRVVDGGIKTDIVANNIDSLRFDYLLNDETQVSPPAADELEDIVAVRITLTVVAANQMDQATRLRSVSSLYRIKN